MGLTVYYINPVDIDLGAARASPRRVTETNSNIIFGSYLHDRRRRPTAHYKFPLFLIEGARI